HEVVTVDPERRDAIYAAELPGAEIVIGQQPMGRDRLDAAPHLRAIFNVETNFLPNIDYERCFQRGIHVLAPSSVFALPVAEIGLGMALSLARNIHGAHGDFRAGRERYGLAGNADAELLTGSEIGMIGFGDLGRALHRLLAPFNARIRVFDPWLPDGLLRRQGVEPADFETVLERSRLVFVVASVTSENRQMIDHRALSRIADGGMLVLLSRAALADFDALAAEAGSGRLRIATDVFPQEPVAPDDPIRRVPGMLFSAHRAGALTSALQQIGALVLEDLAQIARGLPPVSCRRAERETVGRLRSKPVEQS
ncbi:MAG: dehydrogenase, partial [Alphaproteobacteria bacterium]